MKIWTWWKKGVAVATAAAELVLGMAGGGSAAAAADTAPENMAGASASDGVVWSLEEGNVNVSSYGSNVLTYELNFSNLPDICGLQGSLLLPEETCALFSNSSNVEMSYDGDASLVYNTQFGTGEGRIDFTLYHEDGLGKSDLQIQLYAEMPSASTVYDIAWTYDMYTDNKRLDEYPSSIYADYFRFPVEWMEPGYDTGISDGEEIPISRYGMIDAEGSNYFDDSVTLQNGSIDVIVEEYLPTTTSTTNTTTTTTATTTTTTTTATTFTTTYGTTPLSSLETTASPIEVTMGVVQGLKSIESITEPYRTVYVEGDVPDLDGLSFQVVFRTYIDVGFLDPYSQSLLYTTIEPSDKSTYLTLDASGCPVDEIQDSNGETEYQDPQDSTWYSYTLDDLPTGEYTVYVDVTEQINDYITKSVETALDEPDYPRQLVDPFLVKGVTIRFDITIEPEPVVTTDTTRESTTSATTFTTTRTESTTTSDYTRTSDKYTETTERVTTYWTTMESTTTAYRTTSEEKTSTSTTSDTTQTTSLTTTTSDRITGTSEKAYYIELAQPNSSQLVIGNSFHMLYNSNASAVIWSSSDSSVVDVDDEGTVTIYGSGLVSIIAVVMDDPTKSSSVILNIPEAGAETTSSTSNTTGTTTTSTTTTTTDTEDPSAMMGDVNQNNRIDANDAYEILMFTSYLSLGDSDYTFTKDGDMEKEVLLRRLADVDKDNTITMQDAFFVLLYNSHIAMGDHNIQWKDLIPNLP